PIGKLLLQQLSASKPGKVDIFRGEKCCRNVLTSLSTPISRSVRSKESNIERVIFDFWFLALLAVAGSLAGSLLCFLNVIT
ncbi:hypothetical protein FRX31_013712, partial [Thalictrum thalictroides]